jgi:DNA-binding beta-propeller fold protein YncE
VYAIGDLGNLVHVISQSRVIASLPLASYDSSDIVSDATSPLVFVTSHLAAKMAPNTPMVGAPRITIISGTAVINSIDTTPYRPQRMAFDPHFKLLYVVATGGPTVDDASILVIQDGKIIKRETTRQSIETYVVDPMTGDMYTGGSTIFHFRNGEIVEKLELSESTPLHRGRNIRSLILNSKENLLYAIDFVYAEVFVIRNMREIGKIKLNGAIFKSALDPTTGNVYVADFNGNAVTAINATRVLTTYHTGVYPYGVTVNPQNGWVYVSNSKSKTITVLGY